MNQPNRFARLIRSGEISRVEELKATFRRLAFATHPDLRAPGTADDSGEFSRIRSEYEAALADFAHHRHGAPRGASATYRMDDFPAALRILLARGFPKRARHEKERLRYGYARLVVSECLASREGGDGGESFTAFESAFLELRSADPARYSAVRSLLAGMLEYERSPSPALRAVIRLTFASLRVGSGATAGAGTAGDGGVRGGAVSPTPADSGRPDRVMVFVGFLLALLVGELS